MDVNGSGTVEVGDINIMVQCFLFGQCADPPPGITQREQDVVFEKLLNVNNINEMVEIIKPMKLKLEKLKKKSTSERIKLNR